MAHLSQFSRTSPYEARADHVVVVDLHGTVDKADVAAYRQQIYDALESHDKVGLVVDIMGLSDMTPDAVRADIKFELEMFGKLEHFPKIAIVSDKQFMQALVRYCAPMVPAVDMKIFAPDARSDALAFAADIHG